MKLETFFEKFDQFADAPDAVAKMRELVLDLAVQGKLVPQDPNDEPADSIFHATQYFFQRSVAAKKLSPPKPLPPVEDSEVPFSLPSGWAWFRLGQVMRISSGDGLTAKDMIEGPFPVYGGNGVNGYHHKHNVAKRTLVIGRVGFYCGSIHITPERAWVTDNAFITTFDEEHVDMDFLSWLLKATDLRERDNATAQPVISGGKIYPTVLALPPLAEQKRIVAKVDELMALCDRLETQQQERETRHAALARASLARFADAPTPANLEYLFHPSYAIPPADLRKSVLTLAVQGKLVPQDPNDEPAEELLREIEGEKKRLSDSGELKADKKAWLNSSPTPPHDIPDSWSWVRLQDVFEISRGGSPRPAGDPRFFGGSIPWITVGEVTKDSGKYLTATATGLTEEGAERSRFINPGDLLLTNSGATLGVPKISKIRGCMNDGVAILRLFHSFDFNEFGYLYLTHQTAAFRNLNQGMGQPNLNTPIIAGWFFPLPPLAEQRRIVAKVDELMALVDALETQLTASRATAANLLSALVAELTGTPNNGKVSVLSTASTGRRGRPPKS
jgi:type I restriction enzyme S subunit